LQKKFPPHLDGFSKQYDGLHNLCVEIDSLREKRNELIHGMIGYVIGSGSNIYLTDRGNTTNINMRDIDELIESTNNAILTLNRLIRIPGLGVDISTCGFLDMFYDETAIDSDDPLAAKVAT
jgi:hypothetical protein